MEQISSTLQTVNMEYILDVQGFKTRGNEFVFKELAIIPLQEDAAPSVYTFKPPCAWSELEPGYKCTNRWIELNHSGLLWSLGEVPYSHLERVLNTELKGATKIYVKGAEKIKWIGRQLLRATPIIDLFDMGCPSVRALNDSQIMCNNHNSHWIHICAAKNAYLLRNWLLKHNEKRQLDRKNNQHFDVHEDLDEVDTSSHISKKRKICCLQ